MKQIVINISDGEYRFFLKVIKNFPFVKIEDKKTRLLELEAKLSPEKHKIWENIKEGLQEIDHIRKDKIKAKSATEFLNECL